MQTDSQGCVAEERADEIPAEHSRPGPASPPPTRRGSMLLSSRAPLCWPGLTDPCSHSAFSRDPGPPLQEAARRKPAPTLIPGKTRFNTLQQPEDGKEEGRRVCSHLPELHLLLALEDVLLGVPPKLEGLRVPSLLPPPFCVLFQAHPQLKFALKVSNFHFSFSKQLHSSSGTQMLILCAEEWVSLNNKHILEIAIQHLKWARHPGGSKFNQA